MADRNQDSLALRKDLIRSYLERDLPMFGPRAPATTLERLWTLLAHRQATPLNASEIKRARSARVERGFHLACADIGSARAFVVHAGDDRYPASEAIEGVGVRGLADELRALP